MIGIVVIDLAIVCKWDPKTNIGRLHKKDTNFYEILNLNVDLLLCKAISAENEKAAMLFIDVLISLSCFCSEV